MLGPSRSQTGTALRVVAVGSNGEPVSLTAAPSWSPEQPLLHGEPSDLLWKEPFSLSTAVLLRWILAFGRLSGVLLVPTKALSPPPSETELIRSHLPWTGRA